MSNAGAGSVEFIDDGQAGGGSALATAAALALGAIALYASSALVKRFPLPEFHRVGKGAGNRTHNRVQAL